MHVMLQVVYFTPQNQHWVLKRACETICYRYSSNYREVIIIELPSQIDTRLCRPSITVYYEEGTTSNICMPSYS